GGESRYYLYEQRKHLASERELGGRPDRRPRPPRRRRYATGLHPSRTRGSGGTRRLARSMGRDGLRLCRRLGSARAQRAKTGKEPGAGGGGALWTVRATRFRPLLRERRFARRRRRRPSDRRFLSLHRLAAHSEGPNRREIGRASCGV